MSGVIIGINVDAEYFVVGIVVGVGVRVDAGIIVVTDTDIGVQGLASK